MFASPRRFGWTILVLAGLCWSSSASLAIDAKLLPDNTEIVASINLKQILNSELAKSKDVQDLIRQVRLVASQLPGADQAVKRLEKLGIDPAKDLLTLTLAHPGNKGVEELFLVIEGKFDLARIEGTAREAAKDVDGLRVAKIDKVTVLEVTTGANVVFVGLISNKSVVITGKQDLMKDAVARSSGVKASSLKKDVADLLQTINDKQSVSFAVSGRALAALGKGGGLGAIGPAIPAVGGITGSLTFGMEVTFQVGVASKNQAAARELSDQINLGLLLLRTVAAQQAANNPQAGPLLDVANSLRVSVTGNNTVVSGDVSYENLEKLFKNISGK